MAIFVTGDGDTIPSFVTIVIDVINSLRFRSHLMLGLVTRLVISKLHFFFDGEGAPVHGGNVLVRERLIAEVVHSEIIRIDTEIISELVDGGVIVHSTARIVNASPVTTGRSVGLDSICNEGDVGDDVGLLQTEEDITYRGEAVDATIRPELCITSMELVVVAIFLDTELDSGSGGEVVASVERIHLSGVLAKYRITTDLLGHNCCCRSKNIGCLTTETAAVVVSYCVDLVEFHAENIGNSGFVGSNILTTGVVIKIIADPPCSGLMSFKFVVRISGGPTEIVFFYDITFAEDGRIKDIVCCSGAAFVGFGISETDTSSTDIGIRKDTGEGSAILDCVIRINGSGSLFVGDLD